MLLEPIRTFDAEIRPSSWLRSMWALVARIALTADTTTVRLILANASFLWAVAAIGDTGASDRAAFALITAIAPMWAWGAAFALHGLGVYWRIFDPVNRPGWALLVNTYGFALWFVTTAALNLAVGAFTPGSALEWTLCGASAWALFRTGLGREVVTS